MEKGRREEEREIGKRGERRERRIMNSL